MNKKMFNLKTTIPPVRNSISRSPWLLALLLIPLVLACFALSPTAQGVTPAPDGGYGGYNTAEGDNALFSLTTGELNTAVGFQALYGNTSGSGNTALGFQALYSNTGDGNTATGQNALHFNTTGTNNTAIGFEALIANTTGGNNTATGVEALFFNTTGFANTATGFIALEHNRTGSGNTATGAQALLFNTTGNFNTATGDGALTSNTTGNYNTAAGVDALELNTTGNYNTANGVNALFSNTTGANNAATGNRALFSNTTGFSNAAAGWGALSSNTTGSNNAALGYNAGSNLTTGSNNIDIGNSGVAGESSTIRIGSAQIRTFIKGISGVVVSGAAVSVNASGQLGVAASSKRFKDEIKPMDKASEAIFSLKPVTFCYKKEIDPKGIPQFGLVAEEVEKVNPDLVTRDVQGKIYTVRYDAVNAMLLNEFLREHRKVEQQEATIAQLKKDFRATVTQLTARLDKQQAQIQRVSAQVEMSKPAPQMVVNNP